MTADSSPPDVPSGSGDPDRVPSLGDGPEIETVIKSSRFLGQVVKVDEEAEAVTRLDAIRRRYHDATHHCWAYRLIVGLVPGASPAPGTGQTPLERWSDDGEPSGSAGVPILGALQRGEACNALVVVTRYFGGVKLGTGGLVRAYGEAAREAVRAAPRRDLWRVTPLRLACGYEVLGATEAVLTRFGDSIRRIRREFGAGPEYELAVLRSRSGALRAALTDATSGRVTIDPPAAF
jgi:uncharacterized YigZ family protein